MEHITDAVVGKRVVTADGDEVGKVTAVEDDRAILKGETGVSADTEASVSPDEDDRLSLRADQIESVEDDVVRLSGEF
ncbi:DUF2171 domain-containing protein [Halegenticoccus soli]|uniref:DUF2171 domain-containing protein n=1 Tax=Halegenticoccus soli TaxID=1985678 RepID=UPI000C6DA953|nr:DUF2171 domain-containing protein [Halegenticoccus soli]